MNPFTLPQIIKRFNKDQPKYVGLKNSQGEWEVAFNSPKITPKKRMAEIERHFRKDSTPDGIYFFVTKESLHKDHPERSVPVAKGDVRNLPAISEPAPRVTIQERATEDVWDLKTALEKSTELIRLEFKVEQLQKEVRELTVENSRLKELAKDEEKEDTTKAVSQFKEIAEMFRPLVDEHFKLKKERNAIDREKISLMKGNGLPARRNGSASRDRREDGGIPVDHPKYEEYFALVVNEGTNEELDNECNYLEETDPELYKELAEKYGIQEKPEAEEAEKEEDDGQTN